MADNMAKVIIASKPELADSVKSNLEAIKSEMNKLDEELTQKLLPFKGKTMLVFHPAFGYFATRYGMIQKAVEIEGKEPAPRQLAELIRGCRSEGIKIIFVQKQFPAATAETISRSIGGRVVAIDPLAEDYVNNLKAMAEAVVDSAN
jgi:zinc transport system substrate-binding protein